MAKFNYGDLIVSSSPRITEREDLRLLYVGRKEFLERMPQDGPNVSMESTGDPLELVNNWYSQTQNHFIVEVMDAGLRMRPDAVVFDYAEFLSPELSEETLEVVVRNMKMALNTGHAVAVVYDKEKEEGVPDHLQKLFPEFDHVLVD